MHPPDEPATIDVFLLTVSAPRGLPGPAAAKVRRTLNRPTFAAALRGLVAA